MKYDESFGAPFVCANGVGLLAEKILKIADEQNIPIVCEPNLLNVLSMQKIGAIIPEETFEVVAKIFAFIQKIEAK